MSEEIKPCPFCGRKAIVENLGDFGLVNQPPIIKLWWVKCKCDATGPLRKSMERAIKAWNKRVKEKK